MRGEVEFYETNGDARLEIAARLLASEEGATEEIVRLLACACKRVLAALADGRMN